MQVDTHWPEEQPSCAPQDLQLFPLLPHDDVDVPDLQVVPSQQPAQPLMAQGTPQPLSSPGHLPLQSGVQLSLHSPPEQV